MQGSVRRFAAPPANVIPVLMKLSQFYLSTTKEAPAEAEIVSHQLMMRAGMIKKLGAGIYTWMPLGVRVLRKVEAIVREEMNAAGAVELLMPVIQPAELWQESGRWEKMGPEMMRVKDRHERDFIVQPTSEEVITDIARQELRSWRQLPLNLYHIQTKFRDERRPRFGVMRSREFIMKDAYSFDADHDGLMKSYQAMYDAYARIFSRLGLDFRAVKADTGNIGGFASHEFQVLAESGEDVIAYCADSDYAANIEMAEALAPSTPRAAATEALVLTPTPGQKTCEEVAAFLKRPLEHQLKAMMYMSDAGFVLCMVRADHMINEVKLGKLPELANFRPATPEEIETHLGVEPGYCGPVPRHGKAHPGRVLVVADRTAAAMATQRRRGRPVARRPRQLETSARHRGRTRVRARAALFPRAGRPFPGPRTERAGHGNGLLRHRHHARGRRRHRAKPRRSRHHLADPDGAVQRLRCRSRL